MIENLKNCGCRELTRILTKMERDMKRYSHGILQQNEKELNTVRQIKKSEGKRKRTR
jgi:hypothetical protein